MKYILFVIFFSSLLFSSSAEALGLSGDCNRSYFEKVKTGEFDMLDAINPFAGYIESKASLPFEALTGETLFHRFGHRWPDAKFKLFSSFLKGEVGCQKLLQKIKKVVWVGDSMSKDFAVSSSTWANLKQVRTSNQYNAILDTKDNEIKSLFERVSEQEPVYLINLARVGANIVAPLDRTSKWVARKRSLESRLNDILKMSIKPDLIAIWLGHNDLDWADPVEKGESFKLVLSKRRKKFKKSFPQMIRSFIEKLESKGSSKTSIVFFGMGNIAQYAQVAKRKIEAIRECSPQLYKENESSVHDAFQSLKHKNRKNFVSFFNSYYELMKETVLKMIRNQKGRSKVKVFYSDSLYQANWGDHHYYNLIDGWHLSDYGKSQTSKYAYIGLKKAIEYVDESY